MMTAFVVFASGGTRADALLRAAERSAGTIAGLAGGLLLSTLVHGHVALAGGCIVLAYFLSFYFQQVSATISVFLTSLGLPLLLGLAGPLTPAALAFRLVETVLGAACAAVASFLVFPTQTSARVGDALKAYLDALDALVGAFQRRARGEEVPALLPLSRALDQRYTALATLARPLYGFWEVATRFGDVRRKLLLLTGCTHWARVLASTAEAPTGPRVDALVTDVQGKSARLCELRARWFDRASTTAPPVPRSAALHTDDPAFALEAIGTLLGRAVDGA